MPAATSVDAMQRAIDGFALDDLAIAVEKDAALAVRESLARTGLVLVGELHGVHENPLVIHALLNTFGANGLALEWPAELAATVDRFVETGTLVDHPFLWGGDGRLTAGHFGLVRERSKTHAMPLTLFDGVVPQDWTWSDRDEAMAARVLAIPPAPGGTLVVAGNAHTSVHDRRLGTPMAAHLAEARPGLRVITIDYTSGTFFNFEERRFAARDRGDRGARLFLDDTGALILRLPDVHAAVVPVKRLAPA
jgi:hypothetical protein